MNLTLVIFVMPLALQSMLEARDFAACEIGWEIQWRAGSSAGRREKFELRLARNEDMIFARLGDEHGVVDRGPEGQPVSWYPVRTLLESDRCYETRDTTTLLVLRFERAAAAARRALPCDPRLLGLLPTLAQSRGAPSDLFDRFPEPGIASRYSEESRNGRVIVTGEYETQPPIVVEWTLDPARGWNPERVRCWPREDRTAAVLEVVSDLREFPGAWFPDRVTFRRGGDVFCIVAVHQARFFENGGPADFVPADIGAEAGFTIQTFGKLPPELAGLSRPWVWGEARPHPMMDWADRVRSGLAQDGPLIQQFQKYGEIPSPYPTASVVAAPEPDTSGWHAFVRDFIRAHDLDGDQQQKAMSILQDADEAAQALWRRVQSEVRKLDEELGRARGHEDFPLVQSEVQAQRQELFGEPFERIFEDRLQPRLEQLLTRRQARPRAP
jgi:hypothetical protein